MPELVANMLVTVRADDDVVLFDAALRALSPVVDSLVVLDTTPSHLRSFSDVEGMIRKYFSTTISPRYSYHWDEHYIGREGFGAARNVLLDGTPANAYAFWVDTDEIHFSDQLLVLKQSVLDRNTYDDLSINFVHFCLGSNYYEYIEPKVRIFRNIPGLRWEGKAHEHLVYPPGPERKVFYSDYQFHHYGYLRSQDLISDRWDLYAYLEGKRYGRAIEIAEKQQVGFVREGEAVQHSILDDRTGRLFPYCGDYPAAIPKAWIEAKNLSAKERSQKLGILR